MSHLARCNLERRVEVDDAVPLADDGVIVYYANPLQTQLQHASAIIAVGAAIGVATLVADTAVAAAEAELE